MDQIGKENCVIDFILEVSHEEIIGGMDSNEIRASITSEKTTDCIIQKMDQICEESCVKDFILDLSNKEVIQGMDSNKIKVNIAPEKTADWIIRKMDQIREENCVKDFILDSSNKEVIEGIDSNEIRANIPSEKTVQNIKSNPGKGKFKALNVEVKYMTVDLLPKRKTLKRKAAHSLTSSQFQNIRTFVKEKCANYITIIKNYVNKFLNRGVKNALPEETHEANAEEKSKIKTLENIKNDSQNLSQKETIEKPSTLEIIINPIKTLTEHIGTSFGNIRKRVREKYFVIRNVFITCVTNDEDNGVHDGADTEKIFNKFCHIAEYNGVHQRIDGVGVEEQLKKRENIKKDSKDLRVESGRKVAVTKKHSNLFVVFVVTFLLLIVKANINSETSCNRQNLKSSRARQAV